jgi:hypothetical protein
VQGNVYTGKIRMELGGVQQEEITEKGERKE